MKSKPLPLSNFIRSSVKKDLEIKAKKERSHKEEQDCKTKPAIKYEMNGSNQKQNEREVKGRKHKKSEGTQINTQETLNSGHTSPEIGSISHENMFENSNGSIEVCVPSASEVAVVSKVTKVTSEDMEKLKYEHEDFRIQLAIQDTELQLAEVRRACLIDDILRLKTLDDVETLKKRYKKH